MASSALRNLPKTFCAHPGLRRVTLSWDMAVSFRDILWILAGEMGPPCCGRLLWEGWPAWQAAGRQALLPAVLGMIPSSERMCWHGVHCKPEIQEGSCSGETSWLGLSWPAGAAWHRWDRGRGEEGENASPALLDFTFDSDLGLASCLALWKDSQCPL